MSGFAMVSDLDRTLIHPARTLPAGQQRAAEVVEIYQGRGITVAATSMLGTLRQLGGAGAFVPVTTRSREQLARIVPVWQLAGAGYAVCANGATVLRHGQVDPVWDAHIAAEVRASAPLAVARRAIEEELGAPHTVDWMPLLRSCDEHFLYATLDLDRAPATLAADAEQLLSPLGWRSVLHARKLYALPQAICKGAAAAYVLGRIEATEVLAAGDSELDVELLEVADERWCPAGAELIVRDLLPTGTRVTEGRHIASGAEIAARAAERLPAIS